MGVSINTNKTLGVAAGTSIIAPQTSFVNTHSLSGDGSDAYVDLNSVTNLRPTESQLNADGFTVSFWLKRNNTTTGGVWANDNIQGPNVYRGMEIAVGGGGAVVMHKMDGGSPSSSSRSSAIRGGAAIPLNTWTHVVCVFTTGNKTTWKMYINGIDQTLTTSGTGGNVQYTGGGGKAGIGAIRTFYMEGLIDEVACFNAALSQTDAQNIYNSGAPNDLTSLSPTSWWRFEEGSGTTISDLGSAGNAGTLQNSATFDTDVP